MRLMNVDTLQLETFESELPQYAILSHRWVKDELKFSDVTGRNWADETKTPGARKVIDACGQAKKDGFQYMWVDTCCIDKSSSAELSESINSMFNWYRWSEVCYAFLSDVEKEQDFSRSQWFGRGWTLQELIAPRMLRFFDANWNSIGDRTERATEIAEITGIDKAILRHRHSRENIRNSLDFYSVAARLSWFGTRETTRVEDRAYCLMGLFDVNMPLLYGEGEKAVPRLVGEIIQRTADPSILMQLNTSYAFGGGISDPNEIRRLHLYGTDSSRLFNSQVRGELIMECPVYPIFFSEDRRRWVAKGGLNTVGIDQGSDGHALIAVLDSVMADHARIGLLLRPVENHPEFYVQDSSASYIQLRPDPSGSIEASWADIYNGPCHIRSLSFPQQDLKHHRLQMRTEVDAMVLMAVKSEVVSQQIVQSPMLNFSIDNPKIASEAPRVFESQWVGLCISDGNSRRFYVTYGCVSDTHEQHPVAADQGPWCKVLSVADKEELPTSLTPYSDNELGGPEAARWAIGKGAMNDAGEVVLLEDLEIEVYTEFKGNPFLGHAAYNLIINIQPKGSMQM